MVYETCGMWGSGMMGGFFWNWIIGAIIFALIFWGVYALMIKSKPRTKRKR